MFILIDIICVASLVYLYIEKRNTPVRDKKPKENLVISIIIRIFVGENQTFTNNIKRLPNDFKGQSYRNFLYYRWVLQFFWGWKCWKVVNYLWWETSSKTIRLYVRQWNNDGLVAVSLWELSKFQALGAYCFFDNKPKALHGYCIEQTRQLELF